jgi:tRNA-specific 2-thiouridylase
VVLLSGGVDSAVALALLCQRQPRPRAAIYLKIWLEDEVAYLGDCPWEADLGHARAVCRQLAVPLEVVPLQTEYREQVVEAALAELRHGRTPTPDVWCNRRIKFGALTRHLGGTSTAIATGHYARVEPWAGRVRLGRGVDPVKDQTYFLSRLTQDQLRQARFPVGHLLKEEVRELAARLGLSNHDRPDSQGICFLGKVPYREFVRFHLGERPGPIRQAGSDRLLGQHRGHWFHTIGQRFGLGLGGGPWFIVRKDPEANVLWVSHQHGSTPVARHEFHIDAVHWIDGPPAGAALQVRLRHAPELWPCRLTPATDHSWEVVLSQPDAGIAAGQHAVFYEGPYCLGSGVICA